MNKIDLMKINDIWDKVIKEIENQFINKKIYEDCILTSKISDFTNNTLYIITKTIFAKSIIMNDYNDIIMNELKKHISFNFQINCILNEESKIIKLNEGEKIISSLSTDYQQTSLISTFTLENFIVGDFNKNAYSAICAIADKMGSIYNPLFIYSGTGLGKTHLLIALGNQVLKKYPNKKVKYIESDLFVRQVFNALSKGSNFIENLKDEYCSNDLLLIDDIQYLINKEKTNEIFFSIFNSLVKNNKQIVIAADKSPEYLQGFEERMISRFNSGLTLKIVKPDNNSLKKIILQKLDQNESDFLFEDEAILELIKYYNTDLRILIGMINRISFHAIQSLEVSDIITLDFIRKYIANQNIIIPNSTMVNPRMIINSVCKWYGTKEEFIIGSSRLKENANIRHICMYILREKYNMSYKEIGGYFSNRDHTTVMSAVEKIKKVILKDQDLNKYINEILLKN